MTSNSESVPLRVVSWNVGRVYLPLWQNRLADRDVPRVATTLQPLDADVVLLQELADARQLELLIDLLAARGEQYDGALATACSYDRKTAVLVHRRVAPRGGPMFQQLTLPPHGRGLVAAHFRVGGVDGMAVSVHFDVFSARVRVQQAEAVAPLLAALFRGGDHVVVAGGDLNFDPRLALALPALPILSADRNAARAMRAAFPAAAFTSAPTLLGLFAVDHVFGRGRRLCRQRTYVSSGRLPLGDHAPVVWEASLSSV